MYPKKEQVLKYLNIARESPQYFIPLIQKQLKQFQSQYKMTLAKGTVYATNQGKGAWFAAKQFLLQQKPLPPFILHDGLCAAASQRVLDKCSKKGPGSYGSYGSIGLSFTDRIYKYCKEGPGAIAEITGTDFAIEGRNNAEMTVLGLIIDDGNYDRGHRSTVFSTVYKYVGMSCGLEDQNIITVIDLAENVYESGYYPAKGYSDDNSKTSKTYEYQSKTSSSYTSSNPIITKSSSNYPSSLKRIKEKQQKTRTYYDNGSKVIETTTTCTFDDGTTEVTTKTMYQ